MRKIDLTGQRFGKLTVIRLVGRKRIGIWECRCDCGNITNVWQTGLTQGRIHSCGCLYRTRGGESSKRLCHIWRNMLRRCENPKDKAYDFYGGRGIKVCDEWHDYGAFKVWALANGYRDDLTIEREDVNGNYEPSNCCWATMAEQARNRRNSVYVEYQGERYNLSDLARKTGIKVGTLRYRLIQGWTVEQAVGTPVDKRKGHRSVGKTETAAKEKYAERIIAQKGLDCQCHTRQQT